MLKRFIATFLLFSFLIIAENAQTQSATPTSANINNVNRLADEINRVNSETIDNANKQAPTGDDKNNELFSVEGIDNKAEDNKLQEGVADKGADGNKLDTEIGTNNNSNSEKAAGNDTSGLDTEKNANSTGAETAKNSSDTGAKESPSNKEQEKNDTAQNNQNDTSGTGDNKNNDNGDDDAGDKNSNNDNKNNETSQPLPDGEASNDTGKNAASISAAAIQNNKTTTTKSDKKSAAPDKLPGNRKMLDHTAGDGSGTVDPNHTGKGGKIKPAKTAKLKSDSFSNGNLTGKNIKFDKLPASMLGKTPQTIGH